MRIARYRNRSGTVSWRLSGTLADGSRIRRNFRSRPEAEAELAEVLRRQGGADGRAREPRLTWLSADELRDAELAAEVAGRGDLLAAARAWAEQRGRVVGMPLEAAAREYEQTRRAAGVRERTLENVSYTLRHWFGGIRAGTTAEVTARDVQRYVFAPDRGQRTRSDRRQILGQFCRWCVQRGAMAVDYTERLPAVRVERDLPRVLSPAEAGALLEAAAAVADGAMLGYVAVCLFTGVRPTEARRLLDEDLHLEGGLSCLQVPPRVAKVRQARTVDLPDPLRAMLAAAPRPRLRFVRYQFDAIRERAGLLGSWQADILRHTFASYHYAANRDIRGLTYQMGNSEPVLFRAYIRPVTREQAAEFWGVLDALAGGPEPAGGVGGHEGAPAAGGAPPPMDGAPPPEGIRCGGEENEHSDYPSGIREGEPAG